MPSYCPFLTNSCKEWNIFNNYLFWLSEIAHVNVMLTNRLFKLFFSYSKLIYHMSTNFQKRIPVNCSRVVAICNLDMHKCFSKHRFRSVIKILHVSKKLTVLANVAICKYQLLWFSISVGEIAEMKVFISASGILKSPKNQNWLKCTYKNTACLCNNQFQRTLHSKCVLNKDGRKQVKFVTFSKVLKSSTARISILLQLATANRSIKLILAVLLLTLNDSTSLASLLTYAFRKGVLYSQLRYPNISILLARMTRITYVG